MKNNEKPIPNKILSFLWMLSKGYRFNLFVYFLLDVVVLNLPYILFFPLAYKFLVDGLAAKSLDFNNIVFIVFVFSFYNIDGVVNGIILKFKYNSVMKMNELARCEIFKYFIKQSSDFFNKNFSGFVTERVNCLIDGIDKYITYLFSIFRSIFMFIVSIFIFVSIDYRAGIFFLVAAFIYIFVTTDFYKKSNESSEVLSDEKSKLSGIINDCFMNISNIKIFNSEIFETRTIELQTQKIFEKQAKQYRTQNVIDFANCVLSFSVFLFIMGFNLRLLLENKITMGDFVFLINVIIKNIFYVRGVTVDLKILSEISGEMKKSLAVMKNTIEIKNKKDARKLKNVKGRIVFRNIEFSYN